MVLSDLLVTALKAFGIAIAIALIFRFFIWPILKRGKNTISGIYNGLKSKFGSALERNQKLSQNAKAEAQEEFQSRVNADKINRSTQEAASIVKNAKSSNAFTPENVEQLQRIIGSTIQAINEEEEREKSLIERYNQDRQEDNKAINDSKDSISSSKNERTKTIQEAQALEKFNNNDPNLLKLIQIETALTDNLNKIVEYEERDKNSLTQLTNLAKESVQALDNLLQSLNNSLSLSKKQPIMQQISQIDREMVNSMQKAKIYSSIKEKIINLVRERTSRDRPVIEKLFYDTYGLIEEQGPLINIIRADITRLQEEGKATPELSEALGTA